MQNKSFNNNSATIIDKGVVEKDIQLWFWIVVISSTQQL